MYDIKDRTSHVREVTCSFLRCIKSLYFIDMRIQWEKIFNIFRATLLIIINK